MPGQKITGVRTAGGKIKDRFLTYRGNMRCGGQGIHLEPGKEMGRLGHEVTIINGPPYIDPLEGCLRKNSFLIRYLRMFSKTTLAAFKPDFNVGMVEHSNQRFPQPFTFSLHIPTCGGGWQGRF